jgi:hypothetical protein
VCDRCACSAHSGTSSHHVHPHLSQLMLRLDKAHYVPYRTAYRGPLRRPMECIYALVTQGISISHIDRGEGWGIIQIILSIGFKWVRNRRHPAIQIIGFDCVLSLGAICLVDLGLLWQGSGSSENSSSSSFSGSLASWRIQSHFVICLARQLLMCFFRMVYEEIVGVGRS